MSEKSKIEGGETRRAFVGKSAAVMGLAAPVRTPLALFGGPKAVTFPVAEQAALSRWPRYGDAEKKALHDMIDSDKFYEELPAFEKEWQDYTKSPFVKATSTAPARSPACTSRSTCRRAARSWCRPTRSSPPAWRCASSATSRSSSTSTRRPPASTWRTPSAS